MPVVVAWVGLAGAVFVMLLFIFVGSFGGEDLDNTGTWTVAEINAEFIRNPEIRVYRVDIDYADGVVTLSGSVNNEEARREAAILAQKVPTVKQVINNIRVVPKSLAEDIREALSEKTSAPSAPMSEVSHEQIAVDNAIRAEIKRIREEKGDPSNEKVQISVENGVITFTGAVKSRLDVLHARILTEDIPGVRQVNLEVAVVP